MLKLIVISLVLIFCPAALQAQSLKPAAENFEATDMRGDNLSLEGLRGRVVVLTFWSTRCVICHNEIPKLNQMVSAFKGKDVTFLAVTMENPEKVAAYVLSKPFYFEIIPNGFGILLKYATKDDSGNLNMPYPSFFVIGREGNVELKIEGAGRTRQIGDAVDRLLVQARK